MIYSREQIELAMCVIRVLPIIALVAVASFAVKSRTAFLLGSAGALLGFAVPEPYAFTHYSSGEAAYMGSLTDAADHVLFWGMIGACAGFAGPTCLPRAVRRLRFQLSLRTSLIVMTAVALVLGLIRFITTNAGQPQGPPPADQPSADGQDGPLALETR